MKKINENESYLKEQLITYIGNKRNLLNHINHEIELIKNNLNKEKLISVDLFSGSGVVARLLKQHSSKVIANDLEAYSKHEFSPIYFFIILSFYIYLNF